MFLEFSMNGMRFIPSRIHGILDYIVGVLLLLAPEIFGFSQVGGAAVTIPRVIGVLILVQGVLTRYEMGLFKVLPFSFHLAMDYIVGIFLAGSPVLFGFSNQPTNVWLPHVLVGAFIFFSTLFTETQPRYGESDQTISSATS
jgi:hypothetical protein